MMANMRMAKKSSRPICSRGTMAFIMDFNTTWRPDADKRKMILKTQEINVFYLFWFAFIESDSVRTDRKHEERDYDMQQRSPVVNVASYSWDIWCSGLHKLEMGMCWIVWIYCSWWHFKLHENERNFNCFFIFTSGNEYKPANSHGVTGVLVWRLILDLGNT